MFVCRVVTVVVSTILQFFTTHIHRTLVNIYETVETLFKYSGTTLWIYGFLNAVTVSWTLTSFVDQFETHVQVRSPSVLNINGKRTYKWYQSSISQPREYQHKLA